MSGLERAGRNSSVVAARRTKLPETETDCRGNLREMKEKWRRRKRSGGSGGGGGNDHHLFEMGSKEEYSMELS